VDENYEEQFRNAEETNVRETFDGDTEDSVPFEAPVPDEEAVNMSLRALRFWRKEEADVVAEYSNEIEKLQARRDAELERLSRRMQWHLDGLRGYLWASGKKSLKHAYGTLKRIKGRDRVEVEDFSALFEWEKTSNVDVIRIKSEADKKAISAHIKATGEIPGGVDLVTGEDSFKVDTIE